MSCHSDPALERIRDEMHLDWLAKRDAGVSSARIGEPHGLAGSTIRTVLNRIDADLAKSEAQ